MFAGIIKYTGRLASMTTKGSNITLSIETELSKSLNIDQSVAHNGVCLTVVQANNDSYQVVAIKETLDRTNLSELRSGDLINLELCVTADQKIDGHFVQGHVDTIGTVENIEALDGSWYITIDYPEAYASLLVDKGSVAVNGISLTVVNPSNSRFKVAIIPYTFEHTNFKELKSGSKVNLEFDIIGKYINRKLDIMNSAK